MAKDYNDRELINELRTKLRQNQEHIDMLRRAVAELMNEEGLRQRGGNIGTFRMESDNRNADEKDTKHD